MGGLLPAPPLVVIEVDVELGQTHHRHAALERELDEPDEFPTLETDEGKLSQIIQLQGANGEKAQAWLTLGEVAVELSRRLGSLRDALAHFEEIPA